MTSRQAQERIIIAVPSEPQSLSGQLFSHTVTPSDPNLYRIESCGVDKNITRQLQTVVPATVAQPFHQLMIFELPVTELGFQTSDAMVKQTTNQGVHPLLRKGAGLLPMKLQEQFLIFARFRGLSSGDFANSPSTLLKKVRLLIREFSYGGTMSETCWTYKLGKCFPPEKGKG